MSTLQKDLKVKEYINNFKETYSNFRSKLCNISNELKRNCLEIALTESGAYKKFGDYRYDLGKIEYFPIFLELNDKTRVMAGTNCHYVLPYRIKHMLPKIDEFSEKLGQEVERLEKISNSNILIRFLFYLRNYKY
jgi:hypothetical protein